MPIVAHHKLIGESSYATSTHEPCAASGHTFLTKKKKDALSRTNAYWDICTVYGIYLVDVAGATRSSRSRAR
jgi:hypothetical protein